VTTRLAEEPVIALHGLRSVGKSTLLREISALRDREIVDLDDVDTRRAAIEDPTLFTSGPSPVFIDEYQHVPTVLDAIKAELNRGLSPGRFVLTGSTSYQSLPRTAQSLTGRLHVMSILPLSQGELRGVHETFVETLLDNPRRLLSTARSTTSRDEYIERIIGGGMPVPLSRPPGRGRSRWYEDFLSRVVERDVVDLSRIRQRKRMPVVLSRIAGQGAQVLNIARVARDADLEPTTAADYLRLLEAAFLIYRLPAWGRTLRARAAASPKIHVTDTGLAAHLLRLTEASLARLAPSALTELGHLTESFAVAEIRKQLAWSDEIVHIGHWRTHDGDEVDLILERHDGGVVAIEIKAGPRIREKDVAGLRKLRDALGDSFLEGVVLYTGQYSYTIEDRLYSFPLDRLWTV
jgi:uncharacterized protein